MSNGHDQVNCDDVNALYIQGAWGGGFSLFTRMLRRVPLGLKVSYEV